MLARIAHELFWLGRDLARAEHTARTLDGAFHADVAGAGGDRSISLSWNAVLTIIGSKPTQPGQDGVELDRGGRTPLDRYETVRRLTVDPHSPASILSCLARARERGKTLRDVISSEMWQSLNSFYLSAADQDILTALRMGPYSFYRDVKERCAMFWGLTERTMLRDEGRAFLEAGARIEGADMVLRMLRVTIPEDSTTNEHQTEALAVLRAVGGAQAYRRAVREPPTVVPVMRFLLYDTTYPVSVAASVQALALALTAADAQPRVSPPVLRLGRMVADLELQRRTPDTSLTVHATLERTQNELETIEGDIGERYFAPAGLTAVHL